MGHARKGLLESSGSTTNVVAPNLLQGPNAGGNGRAVLLQVSVRNALRQNSNRFDLDFVGRIGQLLDLYQRIGRRIRAYILCAHGSDFR